jgi:YHS domain-containing protein
MSASCLVTQKRVFSWFSESVWDASYWQRQRSHLNDSWEPNLRTSWVDPICGMQVDTFSALAEEIYIGVRYLFLSEGCHRLFTQAPTRHIYRTGTRR